MHSKALLLILFATLVMTGMGGSYAEEASDYTLPAGFVYVADLIPDVILEMRYASDHNFVGNVIPGYEANVAILTREAAEKLKKAADEFRQMGYRIKIFDAYRPARAVRYFVEWANDPNDIRMKAEFYPEFKNKQELLDLEYIARNSSHCKGSALDMTLVDAEGNELDMGTCFDYFGEAAGHGARGLTQEQRSNRKILLETMENNGFKRFDREWWHYRMIGQPYPDTSFDFIVK